MRYYGNEKRQQLISGCVFWGESKNGFVISGITDFSLPKNDPKKGSFTMTTACPRAPRGKKKQQQTDPHGEEKKKKQHSRRMNVRSAYISV